MHFVRVLERGSKGPGVEQGGSGDDSQVSKACSSSHWDDVKSGVEWDKHMVKKPFQFFLNKREASV